MKPLPVEQAAVRRRLPALNGKTGRKVTVEVLGGALTIQWDEKTNHIFMTGPAEFVFDGELEYEV